MGPVAPNSLATPLRIPTTSGRLKEFTAWCFLPAIFFSDRFVPADELAIFRIENHTIWGPWPTLVFSWWLNCCWLPQFWPVNPQSWSTTHLCWLNYTFAGLFLFLLVLRHPFFLVQGPSENGGRPPICSAKVPGLRDGKDPRQRPTLAGAAEWFQATNSPP